MKLASEICPRYQAAIELLGKRWTGLILQVLLGGPRRFGELTGALEVVSERVLSERLKELEKEGVVIRRVIPEAPIRVEYQLTKKGRALGEVIAAIGKWAENWVEVEVPHQPHPAIGKKRKARI
jgi:DNA-binding HxlR family transcriptional regulator